MTPNKSSDPNELLGRKKVKCVISLSLAGVTLNLYLKRRYTMQDYLEELLEQGQQEEWDEAWEVEIQEL